MILDVPFVYAATVVQNGKRRPMPATFRDCVPVTVDEFAAADVGVAFRYRCPGGEAGQIYFHPDRGLIEPLIKTRRQFSPGAEELAGRADRSNIGQRVDAAVREWTANPFFTVQDPHNSLRAARLFNPHEWRQVIEEDREVRVAQIRRRAAELAFVGEEICALASEPVWHVASSPARDRMLILLRRAGEAADRMLPGTVIFRADRFDDAKAFAEHRGGRLGMREPALIDGEIEVLAPEAMSFDGQAWNLCRAAAEAVQWRLRDNPALDGAMAEFDRVLGTGFTTPGTGEAIEQTLAYLRQQGLEEFAGDLEDYGWLWRRSRESTEIHLLDQALAGINMGALR